MSVKPVMFPPGCASSATTTSGLSRNNFRGDGGHVTPAVMPNFQAEVFALDVVKLAKTIDERLDGTRSITSQHRNPPYFGRLLCVDNSMGQQGSTD